MSLLTRARQNRFRRVPVPLLALALLLLPLGLAPAQAPQWWSSRGVTNGKAADDYAVVNQGQLKRLALPFYNRLIAVGYTQDLPWTGGAPDDYAAANIGQVKNLFSFPGGFLDLHRWSFAGPRSAEHPRSDHLQILDAV